jgi:phosphoribosylformylglycinamidine synthase
VGEALTNLVAAQIGAIGKVNLSANWMAAPSVEGDGADLYAAVRAVGMELCPALGITIPVGKDSMSMSTTWTASGGAHRRMSAPVSLIVSAFAPSRDVRKTLTPQLQPIEDSVLMLVELGQWKNRLGGSILAQTLGQTGADCPDVENPGILRAFWECIQQLGAEEKILAYHDRSDGGLFACVAEMAFAGRLGVEIHLPGRGSVLAELFSEELGAVLQVRSRDFDAILGFLLRARVPATVLGTVNSERRVRVVSEGTLVYDECLFALRRIWSGVTHAMARLRDNPECADMEAEGRVDAADPGITPRVSFSIELGGEYAVRPPVAILREQGVNGEVEMAAAFHRAGFEAVDVHMTDVLSGRVSLWNFRGLVACGGFSYGDVLGAGEGWAKSILFNIRARAEFSAFFARTDTFALGVCNGCQMMSNLQSIIPGADLWPRFAQNESGRFEARLCSIRIEPSPSVLLAGMHGAVLPIAVAHGEGRAEFPNPAAAAACEGSGLIAARFVDNTHHVTERYPLNPNGSPNGITALTTRDGRVTVLMPHPERVFRTVQHSWAPPDWSEDAPWMRMFRNARAWIG